MRRVVGEGNGETTEAAETETMEVTDTMEADEAVYMRVVML